MKAKYKMTGCARFLIFLVILVPIAYFGSKYLRDSGTWDKIKDKVENRESNTAERPLEEKQDKIDFPSADSNQADNFNKLRAAYEEQELVLARHLQTIDALQKENDQLRRRLNEPPATTTPANIPSRTETNSPNSSGNPSLDDLLKEADNNLGTSSDTRSEGSLSGTRTDLGKWNFNFSGTSGTIEFYRQNGKLFSRTVVRGDSRLDIDELIRSGDRFTVANSPDGEYYILLQNGDLEAYARNGLQTICKRAD